MSQIAYLECTKCGAHIKAHQPQTVCPNDGGVLYVRYNLENLKNDFKPASLASRPATMWRYAEVLPDAPPVSLGEGFTPMLSSREFSNVFIKEEGLNPTGSFKARGMSVAVTMAKGYGLTKLAAPSAGNAASALAAYAAAAGIEAHIFMPRDVPWPIEWNAKAMAPGSRWWTASSATVPGWWPSEKKKRDGSTSPP